MRACLWKFEVGPLPVSIAASWCYRWHLAQRPPSSGQRPKAAGLCHPESSDIDTLSTGRFGLPPTQGKPRSVPLWCTLGRWDPRFLRSSVWVSVAFVPPPPGLFVFLQITDAGKTAWHHESRTNAHFEGFLGRTSSEIICLRRTWYWSRENN